MMSMMSRLSKNVVGVAICMAATISTVTEASAYRSVFFDSSIDTRNYQVVVNKTFEDLDGELRAEDKYIKEPLGYTRGDAKTKWGSKFDSEDSSKPYVAANPNIFKKWAEDQNSFITSVKPTSKKLTVPAMKLGLQEKETRINNIGDSRSKILEDAIMGYERDNGNLSMIDGLNQILRRIETLKGGYSDEADFKNTLMALGYLFSEGEGGSRSVALSVSPQGEEVSKGETNKEENENLDPDDPDYEGNGNDIVVSMDGGGTVRNVRITQKGVDGELWGEKMLVRADTGYSMSGQAVNAAGKGGVKISYKDAELTGGKPEHYMNVNALPDTYIDPNTIQYIHLKDLIAHALIKHSEGITSVGGSQMGAFESVIYNMLDGALRVLEGTLGLVPLEELVYNSSDVNGVTGSRSEYVLGMYPKVWDKLIVIVFSFTGLISLSVLIFSIMRVFYRMTLDSMNVGKRMDLKEDIAGVLQAVAIMFMVIFAFRVIAFVNYTFVTTVYEALGGGSIKFLDSEALGSGMIANIAMRFMMLYVNVYVNVLYIIRSMNIALLLALTPAFVTAISFGKKQHFATYVKELLGSLFLQSFHALVFLFIFEAQSYLNTGDGTTSVFTSVVLSYSVLPLTKMFKHMLMPSSMMEVGQQLGSQVSNKVKQQNQKTGKFAGKIAGGEMDKFVGKMEDKLGRGSTLSSTLGKLEDKYATQYNKDVESGSPADSLLAGRLNSEERKDINELEEAKKRVQKSSGVGMMIMEKGLNMYERGKVYGSGSSKSVAKGLKELDENKKRRKENRSEMKRVKDDIKAGGFEQVMAKYQAADKFSTGFDGLVKSAEQATESYQITQGAIEGLGFSYASGQVHGGKLGFHGVAKDIDGVKIPDAEERKNMPEEIKAAYSAIEVIQDARKEIGHYERLAEVAVGDDEKEKFAKLAKKQEVKTIERLAGANIETKGLLSEVGNKEKRSSMHIVMRQGYEANSMNGGRTIGITSKKDTSDK